MKIFFNKNIIFGLIIFTLVFSVLPKKSNAQVSTFDGANIVQSTITAANTTGSAFSQYSIQFKEFVLDGLGTMFVKQIIRQITNSVVNWINSGFEGSPSFLQNPGGFFLDVADQLTGEFLAGAVICDEEKMPDGSVVKTNCRGGGPLTALCSPFSLDIKIALAFKYRPRAQTRYSCTLGKIIENSRNAVENSSINGFTAGDFKQGGWPAFVSLSTEPQNNVYGAYLSAESELSWKVASAQAQQKDELGAGKGFLSMRDPKCMKQVAADKQRVADQKLTVKNDPLLGVNVATVEGGNGEPDQLVPIKTKLDCDIVTPGSVIVSSLESNINGPLHELQIADEINEVVNALFAQLVTQVLQKGLSGVSSVNSSGSSYLDQTVADLNAESNPQMIKIRDELVKNVDVYKKNTEEYRNNRETALNVMIDTRRSYDSALACFEQKLQDSSTRYASDKQTIERNIAEINATIINQVSSKATNLLLLLQEAENRLKTLQDIQDRANTARTLNDLNIPSQRYSELLQSRGLTTAQDIQKSKEDLDTTNTEAAPLKQDALRKLQTCQIL